jgi:hypothetical protein
MKLLSDFDGVWTNPEAEARAHGEALDARLIGAAPPARRDEARAWIAAARRATLAAPERWGWSAAGRLSAFADEDPFSAHSALLHYVEARAAEDPTAELLRDGARALGRGSLEAFGLGAHLEGVAQVEAARGPAVLDGAAHAGRAMLAGGVEIVVVSNSLEEKLERWFARAALPHARHPSRTPGALRLRGTARKHELDPERAEPLELGRLRVDVRRPHYEAILREEAPDAVVGDVFSLDLALPLALRRREPAWRHVRLFWIVRDYTPHRLRHLLSSAGEIEPVEGGLEEVADALLG